MLQIESKIKATAKKNKRWNYKTIWFNAWQNDKAESLWATFALTFIEELASSMPLHRMFWAKAKLTLYRFNWGGGLFAVVQAFGIMVAFFGLGFAAIAKHTEIFAFVEHFGSSHDTPTDVGFVGGLGAVVAALTPLASRLKMTLSSPVIKELRKYVESPDYRSNVNFINQFKTDFSKIVKSYVGSEGRVYVFIDDLDRCDVPGAANLAEALNLLLSASGENLIFVIGLDRNIVAAGLSAKYASVLPYLGIGVDEKDGRKRNEYGQAFLEKFIQVPFLVPRPTESAIEEWLTKLNQTPKKDEDKPAIPADSAVSVEAERYLVKIGGDTSDFQKTINEFAELLDFNPRKMKVFSNVLRLRMIVAYETGLLKQVTPKQIAFFTAIVTKWPHITDYLARDDSESPLKKLIDQKKDLDPDFKYWSERPNLMNYLQKHREELLKFDIKPLMSISPRVRTMPRPGELR